MEKDLLSTIQAADYCSMSRISIWKYVKAGYLKASKTPGGNYRILKHDLINFMQKKGIHPIGTYQPVKKKILIVDDNSVIQDQIEKILTKFGYQTDTAADGFQAGIKVMEFKPGLVILDLIMPGMDGFEVCRRIKENPSTAYIKILVITGYGTPENQNRIMAAGADGFMTKPLSLKDLAQKVNSLLGEINENHLLR